MTDFTLGVNYWPRRKAMYWWSDFDEGEVREEFSVIRELGMKVVRLFLLWDDQTGARVGFWAVNCQGETTTDGFATSSAQARQRHKVTTICFTIRWR